MVRMVLPRATAEARLIVVVRASSAESYPGLVETLVEAGVRSIELTLTTPGTLEALPGLADEWGSIVDLGVGTVTKPEQVDRAVQCGARYLVTPNTDPAVLEACEVSGVPFVSGGLTPTELYAGWDAGAAAVKVFPAGQMGAGYIRDLHGPFPALEAIPSGGIDLESGKQWLDAGAIAISVGGPLLGNAVGSGDYAGLRARAESYVALAAAA